MNENAKKAAYFTHHMFLNIGVVIQPECGHGFSLGSNINSFGFGYVEIRVGRIEQMVSFVEGYARRRGGLHNIE